MAWGARASIAILLALAVAMVPLILVQCAVSCEQAHAAASQSGRTCHHAGVATARIGDQPIRCGHDHEATVTTLGDSPAPTIRASAVASAVAVITAQTANLTVVTSRATASASPPRDLLSRRLSVSLRI